jgi:hypothetical protein
VIRRRLAGKSSATAAAACPCLRPFVSVDERGEVRFGCGTKNTR